MEANFSGKMLTSSAVLDHRVITDIVNKRHPMQWVGGNREKFKNNPSQQGSVNGFIR